MCAIANYNLRIFPVLASAVTLSPGPMMVYAVTLNVATVLGLKPFSVCCVADVLVLSNPCPVLYPIWYATMRPLGSEGEIHESSSCKTSGLADRADI